MNDPPPSTTILKQLDLQAPKTALINSIPIAKYYSTASDLRTQAQVYITEHDDERAYVMLKRFVQMVLLTISQHNGINLKQFSKEKREYRNYANDALTQLEEITQNIRRKYDTPSSSKTEETEALPLPSAPLPEGEEDAGVADITNSIALVKVIDSAPVQRTNTWDNLKLNFDASPVERKKPTPLPEAVKPAYPAIVKGSRPVAPPLSRAPSLPMSSILRLRDIYVCTPFARNCSRCGCVLTLLSFQMPPSVMSQFMEYARANTMRDVETCGILTGILKDNKFFISTVCAVTREHFFFLRVPSCAPPTPPPTSLLPLSLSCVCITDSIRSPDVDRNSKARGHLQHMCHTQRRGFV